MAIPKVSVIIPVYNVERYIEKCARSLFQQTLDDMEFIFVDDCTPDQSINIITDVLEDYPYRKAQTKFIRMSQNSGTGAVRRKGQAEATGEYVIHCDSDDWVDADYYNTLYAIALKEDADIVVADFKREYNVRSVTIISQPSSSPRDTIARMSQESFYCMLWNKLIRRNLLVDKCISTIPGIDIWEDVIVTLKSYYYANRVSKAEGVYYHYFINPTSYTANSDNDKSYAQRCHCIAELSRFFSDKDGDWDPLLDFWKMLAKSYLLQPRNFNPSRWRKEYPEAMRNVSKMDSFSIHDLRLMAIANRSTFFATIYAFPFLLRSKIKSHIKALLR